MGACCEPDAYEVMFGTAFSRRLARRYRRRGLDRTARRMVGFLAEHGIEGSSVLEVGGGVGAIQLELLRRGAARATNLELADSYEAEASVLAAEAGAADRMTRRHVDLARTPEAVEPHDIVVLHRVVCCYPDHEALLTAAAHHANRLLVFSHPPRNLFTRFTTAAENLLYRVRGIAFRTYAHPPGAMLAAAGQPHLELVYRRRGPGWNIAGYAPRADPSPTP
jgi:2-polyprenyl-3-methyl-5-hydroxy-6-metoxy-1,4-benzoquinol methylase